MACGCLHAPNTIFLWLRPLTDAEVKKAGSCLQLRQVSHKRLAMVPHPGQGIRDEELQRLLSRSHKRKRRACQARGVLFRPWSGKVDTRQANPLPECGSWEDLACLLDSCARRAAKGSWMESECLAGTRHQRSCGSTLPCRF